VSSIFGRIKPRTRAAPTQGNGKGPAAQAGSEHRTLRVSKAKEPFAIVPESHLQLLTDCACSAAFPVYLVLYLTWCKDPLKRNPVKLNMGKLRAFGYTPRTIYRALESLALVSLVQVTRKHGNSPTVFLAWKNRRKSWR
jgi:hypothetical protein